MTMIRKQVFITAEQNRKLKLRAAATGQAEAELIRAALDRELDNIAENDDWRECLLAFAGSIPDVDHLEARVAENRERWNTRVDEGVRKLRGEG